MLVARLGHVAHGDEDRGGRDRQVDDEHPSPRHRVDEVAAEERAERGRDPAETRPRADGAAAVLDVRTTPRPSPGCSGTSERRGDALQRSAPR